MLRQFLYYRPRLEAALSELDKSRLKLPVISLKRLFPSFDERAVRFDVVPIGPWSSPIADVTMLLKVAVCARPRRVLEVGSYRGYTALMLAKHLEVDGFIVAVDRDPRHGDAYHGLPEEKRIERRVAVVSPEAFELDAPGSYDLIFLDADHSYDAVRHDTRVLLPLLAPTGYMLWHDYANWGRFSGKNGVPEFLHELNGAGTPVASIAGSWLAIHSPAWKTSQGAAEYQAAQLPCDGATADPWATDLARG